MRNQIRGARSTRRTLYLATMILMVVTTAWAQTCYDGCSSFNTYQGYGALNGGSISGTRDSAFGYYALTKNTTGADNTGIGYQTLFYNTDGYSNTAIGSNALYGNTTGYNNAASGAAALYANTTGFDNTASGFATLYANTAGTYNTANGAFALNYNTLGASNTALGYIALYGNTTGSYNAASGAGALYANTTGTYNTASGAFALYGNTTGFANTAVGENALQSNTLGSSNTAVGSAALLSSTGSSNIALGESAGLNLTTGSSNIDIGNKGVAGESNTIRIGKKGTQTAAFVAGVRGTTVAGGIVVLVDANGRLGTTTSSVRFKQNIQPMDKASEVIHALKPVTFRYKNELDPDGIPQFGLVAEDVAKVNPDLVARDEQGKPYTVRYDAVNAMLLNEFLKAHRKIETLEKAFAQQQEKIRALTDNLQKVSARLEVSKSEPRLVSH